MPVSGVVRLPYHDVDVGNGERIEETDLVEFRLLYVGALPSTGNKGRPSEVHAIRRHFHPQLRRLWSAESNLRELARFHLIEQDPRPVNERPQPITEQEQFDFAIKEIGTRWNRAGFDWVPLVTPKMALRCSIDILLLRPDIEEKYV